MTSHARKPLSALLTMSPHSLVLLSNPPGEFPIYLEGDPIQHRGIEAAIVIPPTTQHWIVALRKFLDGRRRLPLKLPTLDRAKHADDRVPACGRQEARKDRPLFVTRGPRLEGEPEERELDLRVLLPPVAVLAIHHLRFLRVHRQLALRQSLTDGGQ